MNVFTVNLVNDIFVKMITRRLAEDKEVCVLEWDGRNMICVVLYVFNHCLVDDWCGDWCAIGVVWCGVLVC